MSVDRNVITEKKAKAREKCLACRKNNGVRKTEVLPSEIGGGVFVQWSLRGEG